MANTWGKNLRISIFGESHGTGIGIVIDGLPAGFEIDMQHVQKQMARRAPGGEYSTKREESDQMRIVSGILNGKTTGAPLCAIIENTGMHSGDYTPKLMRPSHADYVAYKKFNGYNDARGGGHFSGRVTAPLVFCGAIARQLLSKTGITIGAHILSIADVSDQPFDPINIDHQLLKDLSGKTLATIDSAAAQNMGIAIKSALDDGDSVGGVIQCAAIGLPVGLGEPFFSSVESVISAMMFSIPGVKGVSFGSGYELTLLRGSQANDAMYIDGRDVRTTTNRSGGINGGITNGMPMIFTVALRPTPSIAKPQQSVDITEHKDKTINIKGRHDPCIVLRALPVVEACCAICLYDLYIQYKQTL